MPLTTSGEEAQKLLRYSDEQLDESSLSHLQPRTKLGETHLLPWLLHFVAILSYTTIFSFLTHAQLQPKECNILQRTEIPSARQAVQLEVVRWKPTDFTGATRPNEYEGPPTSERDAAWQSLVDVGMYSLTEDEYGMFPAGFETAQVATSTNDHIVVVDMFHQLHCLHMFRALIYNGTNRNVYHEAPSQVPLHIDHCIDYMRQVIMCHGDLTPISLIYRPHGRPTYYPDFSTPRTCRNFEQIYDWALAGNRSGYHMEF